MHPLAPALALFGLVVAGASLAYPPLVLVTAPLTLLVGGLAYRLGPALPVRHAGGALVGLGIVLTLLAVSVVLFGTADMGPSDVILDH